MAAYEDNHNNSSSSSFDDEREDILLLSHTEAAQIILSLSWSLRGVVWVWLDSRQRQVDCRERESVIDLKFFWLGSGVIWLDSQWFGSIPLTKSHAVQLHLALTTFIAQSYTVPPAFLSNAIKDARPKAFRIQIAPPQPGNVVQTGHEGSAVESSEP